MAGASVDEPGRNRMIELHEEMRLLPVAKQPLREVLILVLDAGMRPYREVTPMRWEYMDWQNGRYFVYSSKSKKGHRWVYLSARALEALRARWHGETEGWIFPSKRARSGHRVSVEKQFLAAKKAAGITDKRVVLYCGRHTYGTVTMAESKNPAAVRDAMGHNDLRTTMVYQHQDLSLLRDVINQKNQRLDEQVRSEVAEIVPVPSRTRIWTRTDSAALVGSS